MNEKIKELLEEAGVEVWYDDESGQTVFSGDNVKQLEKFAELIVDECIKICENTNVGKPLTTYDRDMGLTSKVQFIQALKKAFK